MTASRSRKKRIAVRIRAFEPDDAHAVATLRAEVAARGGSLDAPFAQVATIEDELLTLGDDHRILVAEVDGAITASGSLHLSSRVRHRYVADVGMLIAPGADGQGVGSAMLDALIGLAERWCGIMRLQLMVWVDARAALDLYRSRGFHIEGVARAFALRDGRAVDAFHVARVAETLPWPRLTAEEVTQQQPKQLTAGAKKSSEPGNGNGGGHGWGFGGFDLGN